MNERSALNSAKKQGIKQGIEQGKAENISETIAFMREQGLPEEIIQLYIAKLKE